MIKALLLIFSAQATWTRIAETPRRWGLVFLAYLLPTVLIVCAVEGYGLAHWGKVHGEVTKLAPYPLKLVFIYEAAQFILSVGLVFLAAWLIKSLGETFHERHNFSQTFTVAAYGLSPYFLLRLLDAFSGMSPWLTWTVGIFLSIAVLYSGVPIVMRPDPPHAFGLYLMSSIFILILTGLVRFVTAWYLKGKFTRLDAWISQLIN